MSNWARFALYLLLIVMTATVAAAEKNATLGIPINCPRCKFKVEFDLDGDGVKEVIQLKPYEKVTDGGVGVRCCLTVRKKGALIWEDSQHEFPCVVGDSGISDLSVVGNLTGDGKIKVIIPSPSTDPSPTYFRVLQWNGHRFVSWRRGYLKATDKAEKNYKFQEKFPEGGKQAYVVNFESLERPGVMKAGFYGGSKVGKSALVRFTGNGLTVEQWKD